MLKKTAYQIFDVAAAPQLSCLIKKMVGMQQIKVLKVLTLFYFLNDHLLVILNVDTSKKIKAECLKARESWKTSAKIPNRLNDAQHRWLRRILQVSYQDHVTN